MGWPIASMWSLCQVQKQKRAKHLARVLNNELVCEPNACFICLVICLLEYTFVGLLLGHRESVFGDVVTEDGIPLCIASTKNRKYEVAGESRLRTKIGNRNICVDGPHNQTFFRRFVCSSRCLVAPVAHQLMGTTRHGDELHSCSVGSPLQNSPCVLRTVQSNPSPSRRHRRHRHGRVSYKRMCRGLRDVRVGSGGTHLLL